MGPWKLFFLQLASAMATANALIRVSVRSVRTWPRASTVRPAYLASMVIPPTGGNVSVSQIHPSGLLIATQEEHSAPIWLEYLGEATWFWILHFLNHACQELRWAWEKVTRAATYQSSQIKQQTKNEKIKALITYCDVISKRLKWEKALTPLGLS